MDDSRKIPLVATTRQMYAGRALRAGDPFEADSEQDALDLEAANMAKRTEEPLLKRMYRRRDLKAQD